MQMANLSLALQVPARWCFRRQNDQVASPQMSLAPNETLLDFGRGPKIDDEDMARKSRQGKIIERVDDLGNIKPIPTFAMARLHNVLRRNIKNSDLPVAFERSLFHGLFSFLPPKR